jgi:uncharacterized RDD family membrane protein YckC
LNTITINTPQNVNLDYAIAGVGRRILGFFIDLLVLAAYGFLVGYTISNISSNWSPLAVENLLLLPIFFYSLFMHAVFNGRTVGKFAMKTKVVKIDGTPVSLSDLAVLWMLRLVDIWAVSPAVGVLCISFTKNNQRLGGLASNTIVIDLRRETEITHTVLEKLEQSHQVTYPMVDQLTDEQVNEIKSIYSQIQKTRDYKGLKLLREKCEELLNVYPQERDGIFIQNLLKDYYYLTNER